MIGRILVGGALAIVLATPSPVGAQGMLGPKDGAGLAPTDLDRVSVGDTAPDFTLEALDGHRITLSEYRGRSNVVLVFYRGHW